MPQVSDLAKRITGELPASGRPVNLKAVAKRLGVSIDELEPSLATLAAGGLVERESKRRISRADGGKGARGADLSAEALQLLAELPSDGSRLNNIALRSRLELDSDAYDRAKRELCDRNLATMGPGRGGTLARSEAAPTDAEGRSAATTMSSRRGVARESDLYEPFADWVRSSLDSRFVHVAVTGNRRQRKGAGTKWSQPDVTAVTVANFEYLPGASVEVSTFEIKRAGDGDKIESVYETAAHGRWAHRASLVVETFEDEQPVSASVMAEIQRLGLGLYTMTQRASGFSPRELLQPEPREPDAENLDELLRDVFRRNEEERQQFRTAIGR